jgi:hypothetical protein
MRFWHRDGHDSNIRTVTITVSVDELMRLETAAVQERMSIPEYVRAKLFAEDLTPRIQQMFERGQRVHEKMTQIAEMFGKMAELEERPSPNPK